MKDDGKFRCDTCDRVIRGYNYDATPMGDITCGKCLLAEHASNAGLSAVQLAALREVIGGEDIEKHIELIQLKLKGVGGSDL